MSERAVRHLREAVAAFRDGDVWRRWLRWQARFHTYSWRNSLLIVWQRPDASWVCGFKTWLTLGRVVRRGERGIAIIAPRLRKGEDGNQGRVTFGTVYVFDVAQTDPLPGARDVFDPRLVVPTLTDERGEALYQSLVRMLANDGIVVTTGETGGTTGYVVPTTRRMVISDGSGTQRFAALAHEAAHYWVHNDPLRPVSPTLTRVVAEATSYVVAKHFGIDTEARAVPSLALWCGNDTAALERGLHTIERVSRRMIDALALGAA